MTREKLQREYAREMLPYVSLFKGVEPSTLESLANVVGYEDFESLGTAASRGTESLGGVIIHEGRMPNKFYILTLGAVEISIPSVTGDEVVAELTAIGRDRYEDNFPFFGEMGFLFQSLTQATVCASKPHTRCLTVSRHVFSQFIKFLPDFEERIKHIADQRNRLNELRITDQKMRKQIQEITRDKTGNVLSQCLTYIVACQRANRERDLVGRRCRAQDID